MYSVMLHRFASIGLPIIFIVCIFLSFPLPAQRLITTEAGASLRVYSPEDGIPSNAPTNAFFSNDGYLWMSTTGGTVRISGNEIEDFGPEYGIPMMHRTYYDRVRDNIWFTDTETLAKFDGTTISRFSKDAGFNPPGGARKEVIAMLADTKDRFWIGSYTPPLDSPHNGGLVLYQNGQFKNFSKDEMPLHNVSGIFESSDGSVWFTSFGSQREGFNFNDSWVARYKDDEFKVFDAPGSCLNVATMFREPDGFTVGISEDINGNLWFNCNGRVNPSTMTREGNGLYRFNGDSFERIDYVGDRLDYDKQIYDVFYDNENDELYVTLSRQQGFKARELSTIVLVHRDGRWEYENIVEPDRFAELVADEYDIDALIPFSFYLTRTDTGYFIASLLIIDPATERMFSLVFIKDEDEWRWMDTLPAFIFMNLAENVFLTAHNDPDVFGIYTFPNSRLLTEADGLLKSPAEGGQFFTDSDGNVWLTYQNSWDEDSRSWNSVGVSKWDGEQIHNFTSGDGFSTNAIFGPIQAADGSLWFPTDQGVSRLIRENSEYIIKNFFAENNRPFRATHVIESPDGEIFAYANYVAPESEQQPEYTFFFGRFNGEYFEPYESPYPDSLTSLPYQSFELTADRENRLWLNGRFASSNNGLFTAISHIRVLEGNSWIDPTHTWQIPKTRLFYVGALDNDKYYIVDGGFYKVDFDRELFIDLTDSVDVNADFRILQRVNTSGMQFHIEGAEHLYIRFRDMGIAVFDGTNLTYLDRRNGLPSLRLIYPNRDRNGDMLFTIPTGGVIFSGTEFTSIKDDAVTDGAPRAIARDKNNNILILYLGIGVTVTKPDTTNYPVRIASVKADTSLYFERQSARLNSNQNNIEFRFATLNFINPDAVQFSYYLEGFDQEWTRPSRVNFTEYRNLPSGRYTFRVRGISPGNIITEDASFEFIIDPPWWRTTAAYVMYFFLFIGLIFSADRIQRKRVIARERERTREKELAQAKEIEKAYENLKAAQRQLVQQEKLASLGQLTAGIAHEIKNPLNFVNNFASVSMELLDEAMDEMRQENTVTLNGEISEILTDIKSNLLKIHEHGTRADNIVKSMLLHSRGKSGEKIPTDVNRLLDEYVKLAYHGMRAVDKSFNIDIQTEYDSELPKINIVPQDVSRAFLNILNNGMYAANEYSRSNAGRKPVICIKTRRLKNSAEIRIKDNGSGIPEEIREKIFEPFFTTKPTGAGTGLGLSMTFDIIKLHEGSLKVDSKTGEYTEFIIELPI